MTVSLRLPILILLANSVTSLAGGIFSDLSYVDACKKASQEKKLVFLDFYTTWCGPCKAMENTVFKEKKVVDWMTSKAICLKIDADKKKNLAKQFRVRSFPTLMFVKPDGTVAGRIDNAILDSDEFLKSMKALVAAANESPEDKALKRLKTLGENSPLARYDYAFNMKHLGHHDIATEHFLWCLDKGPSIHPSIAAALIWYSSHELSEMMETYPPAQAELQKRRDTARKAIRSAEEIEDLERYVVMRFVYISQALGQDQAAVTEFDALRKAKAPAAITRLVFDYAFTDLVDAKRYQDIADIIDFDEEIQTTIQRAKLHNLEKFKLTKLQEWDQARIAERITAFYQVLLGLGETQRAARIATEALKIYDSPHTLNDLAWAGLVSGKPIEENLKQAQNAHELMKGKSPEIIDTLARLLNHMGKQNQACQLIEDGRKTVPDTPYDHNILDLCAREIGCPPQGDKEKNNETNTGALPTTDE